MIFLRLIARLAAACLLFSLFAVIALPALAADGAVTVGWGDLVGQLLDTLKNALSVLIACAVFGILAILPKWAQDFIRPLVMTYRVDQLFTNAAASAIAGVKGSIAGKELTIPVANDLIRTAAQIALDNGSSKVIDFAGKTIESIAQKVMARLQAQGVVFPEDYTLAHAAEAASAPVVATIVNPK